MKTALTRVTDVGLSQAASSEVFHAAGTLVLDYGQLLVNGVAQATPKVVVLTDNLVIRHNAGSNHVETLYSVATVGTSSWIFSSTTTTPPNSNNPVYESQAPVDLILFEDWSVPKVETFAPLSIIDVNTTSYAKTVIPSEVVEPTGEDYYTLADTILSVDPFNNTIFRMLAGTKQQLPSIVLEKDAHPTSVEYYTGADGSTFSLLVAAQGQNKVLVLDGFDAVYDSFDALTPTSLYVDRAAGMLYVTEYGNSTVLRINLNDRTETRFTVGAQPYELHGIGSSVFVACLGDNKLYKLGGPSVTTGLAPWRVLCIGTKVYVACSFSNEVRVYDSASLALTATIPTGNIPFSLTATATKLFVGCYGINTLEVYDLTTLEKLSSVALDTYAFGAVANAAATDIFVSILGSGLPERLHLADYVVDRFSFEPEVGCLAGSDHTSSAVFASGFLETFAMPASIPPGYGATLFKNGVSVGESTTVAIGDSLTVSATAGSILNPVYEVPVTIGMFTNSYVLYTDTTPNLFTPFTFGAGTALPGASRLSNEIDVKGIRHDSLVATTSAGTLFKNGVDVGPTTTVDNGDKISVQLVAAPSGMVSADVSIGSESATYYLWTVTAATHLIGFPNFLSEDGVELNTVCASTSAPLRIEVRPQPEPIPVPDPPPDPLPDPWPPVQPEPLPPWTVPYQVVSGTLRVNGVDVPSTGELKDFDVLTLLTTSSSKNYATTSAIVIVDGQLCVYGVRTIPDLLPDQVYLKEEFESVPHATYETQFTITGISNGPFVKVPVSVDWGDLFLNGSPVTRFALAGLGDVVRWRLQVDGPFSGNINYPLQVGDVDAVWSFHNLSLKGVNKGRIITGHVEDVESTWTYQTTIQSTANTASYSMSTTVQRKSVALAPYRRTPNSTKVTAPLFAKTKLHINTFESTKIYVRPVPANRNVFVALPVPVKSRPSKTYAVTSTPVVAKTIRFKGGDRVWVRTFPVMHFVLINRVPTACTRPRPGLASTSAVKMSSHNSGLWQASFEVRHTTAKLVGDTFTSSSRVAAVFDDHQATKMGAANSVFDAMPLLKVDGNNFALFAGLPTVKAQPTIKMFAALPTIKAQPTIKQFAALPTTKFRPKYSTWSVQTFKAKPIAKQLASLTAKHVSIRAKPVATAWEAGSISAYKFVPPSPVKSVSSQRTALYPNDDGMFSNTQVALEFARTQGYVDIQTLLVGSRYIYIGDCATRKAQHHMGWVRGG